MNNASEKLKMENLSLLLLFLMVSISTVATFHSTKPHADIPSINERNGKKNNETL